jgi:hypothetical protein
MIPIQDLINISNKRNQLLQKAIIDYNKRKSNHNDQIEDNINL